MSVSLRWTGTGVAFLQATNPEEYEAFGKPTTGADLSDEVLAKCRGWGLPPECLVDRELAEGTLPLKSAARAALDFFVWPTGRFVKFGLALSLAVLAIDTAGLADTDALKLSDARFAGAAPWRRALNLFAYFSVLKHTMIAVNAHLMMAATNCVPKCVAFNAVLWAEASAARGPRGAHPCDAHTWPPVLFISAARVPWYFAAWLPLDLPGLLLLMPLKAYGGEAPPAAGRPPTTTAAARGYHPHAALAVWCFYLVPALSHHLLWFGGAIGDRLRTIQMVRGSNMSQYAFWTLVLHLTRPTAKSAAASAAELIGYGAVSLVLGTVVMLAIGARPSARRGAATKAE